MFCIACNPGERIDDLISNRKSPNIFAARPNIARVAPDFTQKKPGADKQTLAEHRAHEKTPKAG